MGMFVCVCVHVCACVRVVSSILMVLEINLILNFVLHFYIRIEYYVVFPCAYNIDVWFRRYPPTVFSRLNAAAFIFFTLLRDAVFI